MAEKRPLANYKGNQRDLRENDTLPVDNLPAATTSAKGAVELTTSGEEAADKVVQGNDSRVMQASTTNRGTSELATTAEIDTATDAQRPITPDTFNHSIFSNANDNILIKLSLFNLRNRYSFFKMICL